MINETDEAIALEVRRLLDEAHVEFGRGFDMEAILTRGFLRLTPLAVRRLAIQGLVCIASGHEQPGPDRPTPGTAQPR